MPGQCVWAAAQALEARDGMESVAHLLKGILHDDVLTRDLLVSQPAAAPGWSGPGSGWATPTSPSAPSAPMSRLALMNRSFRSVQAAAEHAAGPYARDADALEAASERHLDPWARASALEDASRVRSARVPERDQAVDLLRRAADAYLGAGASRDSHGSRAGSANSTTTAAGRPAAGPGSAGSPTPSSPWPSWSARDSPTAGVGSQLYISPHTVAFHPRRSSASST